MFSVPGRWLKKNMPFALICGYVLTGLATVAAAQTSTGGGVNWNQQMDKWLVESKDLKQEDLPALEAAAASGDLRATYLLYAESELPRFKFSERPAWRQLTAQVQHFAEAGNPVGMHMACIRLLNGHGGLTKDSNAALKWCEKAAAQDIGRSMQTVGDMNLEGLAGLSKNTKTGVSWFERAAAMGDTAAMFKLGIYYRDGLRGLEKNDRQALSWFQKAAAAGDSGSQVSIGVMYLAGAPNLAKDEREAAIWFKKAADLGDVRGMTNLGIVLARPNLGANLDERQAFGWFKKAADLGEATAMFYLGRFYRYGLGGQEKSDLQALNWFQKAAASGSVAAYTNIGSMHGQGLGGLVKDDVQKMAWYQKAADAGDAFGMSLLAIDFRDKNLPLKAVEWAQKSADAGGFSGMEMLAHFYSEGYGRLVKDWSQARLWAQRAVDSGSLYGYSQLADFASSDSEKLRYLQIGAEKGDSVSMIKLADRFRAENGATAQIRNEAARLYSKASTVTNPSAHSATFNDTGERPPTRAKRLIEEMILRGEITDPVLLQELKALGNPAPTLQWSRPTNEVKTEQATLRVRVDDAGGGIGRVELRLNGVAVGLLEPMDAAAREAGAGGTAAGTSGVWEHTLRLPMGEHKLEVWAYNKDNLLNFNKLTGSIRSSYEVPRKPRLFALVVGVDDYKNTNLKLKFAVSDAEAIAKVLEQQRVNTKLYSGGKVTLLTGLANTGKARIESELKALHNGTQVHADDVFVLYVAGHGWFDSEKQSYHMFTSDVLQTSPERLADTTVSGDDLRNLIGNIPAQKKMLVLDTCNSGAFVRQGAQGLIQARNGMADQQITQALRIRTGAAVFAASGSAEDALEGYNGHGVFSYFLLKGLKGDAAPGQNLVRTADLQKYVEDNVPVVAATMRSGKSQVPLVSAMGSFAVSAR